MTWQHRHKHGNSLCLMKSIDESIQYIGDQFRSLMKENPNKKGRDQPVHTGNLKLHMKTCQFSCWRNVTNCE